MCNADFKFQNHSMTISENLCVKNLKIIENDFFIDVLKKINKHLAEEKKVLVCLEAFNGAPWN